MTEFAADLAKFAEWAASLEREIEATQIVAAAPHDDRVFPLLRAADALRLGLKSYQWREMAKYLRSLDDLSPEGGRNHRVTLSQVHAYLDHRGIRPKRPDSSKSGIRVAVANFKGGAAKSTTCLHLAISLAMRGYRVLAIDTDPQATLTRYLGYRPWFLNASQSLAGTWFPQDYFMEPEDVAAAEAQGVQGLDQIVFPEPIKTHVDGLDLLPGSTGLTEIDVDLITRVGGQDTPQLINQLDENLAVYAKDYDIVITDFQPAFSLFQSFLLKAHDALVLPVPTESADVAGTADFLHQVSQVLMSFERVDGVHKVWDPTLVVHTKRRLKNAEVVEAMAGKVFGVHRPLVHVDDSTAVSASLSALKSVYEAISSDYDLRAIKRARDQYDAVAAFVESALRKRWFEVSGEERYGSQ
ncbi:MAG: AAA family ATPase [Planctomycetales bacterium]|nr:AAA family ATPase [Planctomycetales bacterium]